MTKTDPKPVIYVALAELIDLAAAVRPDWHRDQVQGAVMDAKMSGLTWSQALVGMVRLLVDPDATPGELVPVKLDPQRPGPLSVGDPSRHADALAEARIDCAQAAAKLKADENARTP